MTEQATIKEAWERPAIMRMAAADAENGGLTSAEGASGKGKSRKS